MRADAWTRFWLKVAIRDGCWEWTASVNGKGYPNFTAASGKPQLAHRFVFKQWRGEIAASLQIDHLCANRRCVRPDHLEAVTPSVNVRRRAWRYKTQCLRGHAYDDANTLHRSDGVRVCRACNRLRDRSRRTSAA